MIYRRDFLQHVGWDDQLVSVGAFRIHVQLLFAKRSQDLRFSLYLNYGFQRTSEMKNCKHRRGDRAHRPGAERTLGRSRGQARFERERYSPPRAARNGILPTV
jgi:hypothetical protein